ncbi:hypothetical protein MKZ38_007522 [Zalerion maritima]|uniref:Uncharacterized protein n=1 Tax=Zalerion maritima TaxID=339359 RepID=A0AAD5WP50_9PEZI|nr:hypothetical protein MKZ38_007522 [Zalerion maritima]
MPIAFTVMERVLLFALASLFILVYYRITLRMAVENVLRAAYTIVSVLINLIWVLVEIVCTTIYYIIQPRQGLRSPEEDLAGKYVPRSRRHRPKTDRWFTKIFLRLLYVYALAMLLYFGGMMVCHVYSLLAIVSYTIPSVLDYLLEWLPITLPEFPERGKFNIPEMDKELWEDIAPALYALPSRIIPFLTETMEFILWLSYWIIMLLIWTLTRAISFVLPGWLLFSALSGWWGGNNSNKNRTLASLLWFVFFFTGIGHSTLWPCCIGCPIRDHKCILNILEEERLSRERQEAIAQEHLRKGPHFDQARFPAAKPYPASLGASLTCACVYSKDYREEKRCYFSPVICKINEHTMSEEAWYNLAACIPSVLTLFLVVFVSGTFSLWLYDEEFMAIPSGDPSDSYFRSYASIWLYVMFWRGSGWWGYAHLALLWFGIVLTRWLPRIETPEWVKCLIYGPGEGRPGLYRVPSISSDDSDEEPPPPPRWRRCYRAPTAVSVDSDESEPEPDPRPCPREPGTYRVPTFATDSSDEDALGTPILYPRPRYNNPSIYNLCGLLPLYSCWACCIPFCHFIRDNLVPILIWVYNFNITFLTTMLCIFLKFIRRIIPPTIIVKFYRLRYCVLNHLFVANPLTSAFLILWTLILFHKVLLSFPWLDVTTAPLRFALL